MSVWKEQAKEYWYAITHPGGILEMIVAEAPSMLTLPSKVEKLALDLDAISKTKEEDDARRILDKWCDELIISGPFPNLSRIGVRAGYQSSESFMEFYRDQDGTIYCLTPQADMVSLSDKYTQGNQRITGDNYLKLAPYALSKIARTISSRLQQDTQKAA